MTKEIEYPILLSGRDSELKSSEHQTKFIEILVEKINKNLKSTRRVGLIPSEAIKLNKYLEKLFKFLSL